MQKKMQEITTVLFQKRKSIVGADDPVRPQTEQGITLIALIITIIVMLILVAVTIRTAVNSGLFKHAGDATTKWADAQNEEANMGNDIDDLVKKYGPGVSIHDWIRDGDNISCRYCELAFEIGDYLDYKPDTVTTGVKVTKEESGHSSEQIIEQTNETNWRVMGIEDKDGDGVNEGLLIKMDTANAPDATLVGAKTYSNGPDILNRICKELYSSNKYGEARSININDINHTFEYVPRGGFYWNSSKEIYDEVDGFDLTIKEILSEEEWNTAISGGTYTPDGINTAERLGEYKVNGYFYSCIFDQDEIVNDATGELTKTTENRIDVIFNDGEGGDSYYFLASTGMFYTLRNEISFQIALVRSEIVGTCSDCFTSGGYGVPYTVSICPVVSLTSNIPGRIDRPEVYSSLSPWWQNQGSEGWELPPEE